jgi:hypothetical protein
MLEEAGRAGIPVQLLVNKADRIDAADVDRVLSLVSEATAGTNVDSRGPVLAFSAKKALAARVKGDVGGLADANWAAVERLLRDGIVGRSAELKEGALRRRAAHVVETLERAWTQRATREDTEARRRADRAHSAALAAARLDRDRASIADGLASALATPARAWEHDVALVFAGRDRNAAPHDPALARYRVDRAVAAIAPPLARAMAALAPDAGVTPDEVTAAARAIVRGVAEGLGSTPTPALALLLDAAARTAVDTLSEHLRAPAAAPPPVGRAAGVLRELRAFAAALRRIS